MTVLTHVWKKLHTFPHMFEVAEATGKLMDYDLSGNRHSATSTTLRHITYCRWKLHLADLDTLVPRGTMSESMWEFLANVLRIYLPHHTGLCNAHVLPKGKTGEVLLRKHEQKSLYIFPFRTRSKHWVMFLLRKEDAAHTLHILHPPDIEDTAREWAINHFKFKFTLKTAPERIHATNTDGF